MCQKIVFIATVTMLISQGCRSLCWKSHESGFYCKSVACCIGFTALSLECIRLISSTNIKNWRLKNKCLIYLYFDQNKSTIIINSVWPKCMHVQWLLIQISAKESVLILMIMA